MLRDYNQAKYLKREGHAKHEAEPKLFLSGSPFFRLGKRAFVRGGCLAQCWQVKERMNRLSALGLRSVIVFASQCKEGKHSCLEDLLGGSYEDVEIWDVHTGSICI